MSLEQVQRRKKSKLIEDKKDKVLALTDEIVQMRNSVEIIEHPNFVSWHKVNVGNKLKENLDVLKGSKDHATMLRAQGAVEVLESLDNWHKNINNQIDKNRKTIERLTKDINNE